MASLYHLNRLERDYIYYENEKSLDFSIKLIFFAQINSPTSVNQQRKQLDYQCSWMLQHSLETNKLFFPSEQNLENYQLSYRSCNGEQDHLQSTSRDSVPLEWVAFNHPHATQFEFTSRVRVKIQFSVVWDIDGENSTEDHRFGTFFMTQLDCFMSFLLNCLLF